jgi:hypothetical protein
MVSMRAWTMCVQWGIPSVCRVPGIESVLPRNELVMLHPLIHINANHTCFKWEVCNMESSLMTPQLNTSIQAGLIFPQVLAFHSAYFSELSCNGSSSYNPCFLVFWFWRFFCQYWGLNSGPLSLEPSCQPCSVLIIFEIGSRELFAQVGFKPKSSGSLPHE